MSSEWQSLPPQMRQQLKMQAGSIVPPMSVEEVKTMLDTTEKGGIRNSMHRPFSLQTKL